MPEDDQKETQADEKQKINRPQKIYLKDVSFESPNSPELFTVKWEPKLGMEMDNSVAVLGDDLYEVILTVTATASVNDKTAFLAEVHQAGIFLLKGYEADVLQRVQQVYCLNTLYPYASAALSDLVTKGGFPQLLLPPMHFGALYAQKQQQNSEAQEASSND
jgi:preprotein translocase subunit SecB